MPGGMSGGISTQTPYPSSVIPARYAIDSSPRVSTTLPQGRTHARSRTHAQNNASTSNGPARMYSEGIGGPQGFSGVPPILCSSRHIPHRSEHVLKGFPHKISHLELKRLQVNRHRVPAYENSRVWHGSLFVNFSQKSSLKGASQDVEFA
jgi:hypothetical protein